jgi:hypothetical protein
MKRDVRSDQYMCCLGEDHPCPMNVDDGYCTANECQYMVIDNTEWEKARSTRLPPMPTHKGG